MKIMIWSIAGLLLITAAGLSIWTFGGLNKAEQWPIRWLEVAGELDRTTAEQVRAAVAQEAALGFFAVDIERARNAIERLPWVERVYISRHWPDALEITVVEHRVVARWNQTGLMSANGAVFDVAGTAGMQGLVDLKGPESRQQDVFQTWQQLRMELVQSGLDLNQLVLDPRGAWSLRLDSGQLLLLGREQIQHRLKRFLAVHRQLVNMNSIARIDLRYPNGLAITPVKPPVEQPANAGETALQSAPWPGHVSEFGSRLVKSQDRDPAKEEEHG